MTRVHRLNVTYPPTSHPSLPDYDSGWEPDGWGDDIRAEWAKYREEMAAYRANRDDGTWPDWITPPEPRMPDLQVYPWPGWPMNRLYLSLNGARARADLFRRYGATVTIERSAPVTGWATVGDPASGSED